MGGGERARTSLAAVSASAFIVTTIAMVISVAFVCAPSGFAQDRLIAKTRSEPDTGAAGAIDHRRLATEFDSRLAQIHPQDDATLLELARWAAAKQLIPQADRAYRDLLDRDANHEAAHRELTSLWGNHPLPRESDVYRSARALLPAQFREYETARFLILSDAETEWSRMQGEHLERARHQFLRWTRRMDLRPLPPRHKLVCVLFADKHSYQKFAFEQDDFNLESICGYYSPAHDWTVFYDSRVSPAVLEAHRTLHDMRIDIARLERDANAAARGGEDQSASALRDQLDLARKHLHQQEAIVAQYVREQNIATLIHEATHQLLFHTGVQTPRVHYPLWISEGLATCFETVSPQEAFGPDHPYAPRRQQFRILHNANQLLPLRELITIDELGENDSDRLNVIYHQSFALIAWMNRFRKAELREYLMSMLRETPGRYSSKRHIELFEAAFGPVDSLERAWLKHEREGMMTIAQQSPEAGPD